MSDVEKMRAFLETQTHMVIAVVREDGSPWAVPVRIKSWSASEFTWDSALDTEHSKALTINPTMAITIFKKQKNTQTGFYAEGTARLVKEFKPGFGRYVFKASRSWLNDETFHKREVNL